MKKIVILFAGISLLCSCGASKMNMAGRFEDTCQDGNWTRIVRLSLNQDSTFTLIWGDTSSGKWSQKGNDSLFLSYDPLEFPWCLAYTPPYLNPKSLKIISINKLKYELIKLKRIE